MAGEPLEVILGWAEFCGLRIPVEAGVFVPRRRTEALARHAISLAGGAGTRRPAVVADVCCGTGAIGAAILAALGRRVELHAADVDPAAVRNAVRTLGAGARVHAGDLYAALPTDLLGRIDVLVANVPYVPSGRIGQLPPEARLHEPRAALDGGPDGLAVADRLLTGAREWLTPGGHVLFEAGTGQVPAAVRMIVTCGLLPSTVEDDLGTTVVIGQAPAPPPP